MPSIAAASNQTLIVALLESILGFDTATAACTVGIARRARIEAEQRIVDREHNRLLLPMIERIVGSEDFDAVAFGRGPGSFTGVRIAAGVAQGISLARALPVLMVSTLATIAAGVLRHDSSAAPVLVCTMATRDEIYTACYARGANDLPTSLTDERVVALSRFGPEVVPSGATLAGDATARVLQVLPRESVRIADWPYPHAHDLLRLARVQLDAGDYVDAANAVPVYLEGTGRFRKQVRG